MKKENPEKKNDEETDVIVRKEIKDSKRIGEYLKRYPQTKPTTDELKLITNIAPDMLDLNKIAVLPVLICRQIDYDRKRVLSNEFFRSVVRLVNENGVAIQSPEYYATGQPFPVARIFTSWIFSAGVEKYVLGLAYMVHQYNLFDEGHDVALSYEIGNVDYHDFEIPTKDFEYSVIVPDYDDFFMRLTVTRPMCIGSSRVYSPMMLDWFRSSRNSKKN